MRYLLLIYNTAEHEQEVVNSEEAMRTEYQEYMEFNDVAEKSGTLRSGIQLQSPTTATTVRVRDGKISTTDGPFAETKEHLGGYYLLDCDNLDTAVELAAKIPGAKYASVEVRPIVEYGQ
jgi:hypothetical protein